MEKICNRCSSKTTERTAAEKKALANRLRRIEGQVRGIIYMIERDAYCTDILMQTNAVSSALSSFSKELLSSHIKSCVVSDIKEDKLDTVDDLVHTVLSLVK